MWVTNFTNPQQDLFQILNEKGEIKNAKLMPKISKEKLLEAYKYMCFSRMQEKMQLEMNKVDGKIVKVINFLPSTGQEATEVAYGIQIRRGIDWFSPAYRNNAGWISAGLPFRNILSYWLGNEKGSCVPENINILPVNIPIGTQYSHAVGIAFAEKYKGTDAVAFTTIGDGGTSEGEFFEALNFAALHALPVVFFVENNQWSLDTPTARATKSPTFAQKGTAVGVPNILVDGNDFFAVYKVVQDAITRAQKGEGPSLIEAYTYRQLAHSAFDIKKDYFTKEHYAAEDGWLKKDPIERLYNYLLEKKYWSEAEQQAWNKETEAFIKSEIEYVMNNNDVTIEEIFDYTYAEKTPILEEQLAEAKAFFEKAHGGK